MNFLGAVSLVNLGSDDGFINVYMCQVKLQTLNMCSLLNIKYINKAVFFFKLMIMYRSE